MQTICKTYKKKHFIECEQSQKQRKAYSKKFDIIQK